jgi:DNA polymerase I-like protein with 3'-5' exonuclease and polymerase domains
MMLLALISLHRRMPPEEAKIVGTVHDSILFEIREDVVDVWVRRIKRTMENLPLEKKFGVTLDVPIQVDIKTGQHWSETEEVQA